MYSLPSTSHTRAPSARPMNSGSPPTERNARTGELTPPGIDFFARSNSDLDICVFLAIVVAWLVSVCVSVSVGDAFFLGQRLRLALRLGGEHGRIQLDFLALALFLALGEALERRDLFAFLEADQAYALGVAADG